MAREEGLEGGDVGGKAGARAGPEGVGVAECHLGQVLGRRGAADGGVVLESLERREQRRVAGRAPADAQAAETPALGQGAQRDGAGIEVRPGWEAVGDIELEAAIDLVGEHVEAVAIGQRDERGLGLVRHRGAGRVVRGVEDQRLRARCDQRRDAVGIEGPGVGFVDLAGDRRGACLFLTSVLQVIC